jgi:hypothetical protein
MGSWRNVAFVRSGDLERVKQELIALVIGRRRHLVKPARRIPAGYDSMQYGKGDEVWRWGVAGFHGAPGWTVVRTAPWELLLQGDRPLLVELAARLKVPAFQYNLYDSTSQFLFEVDRDGRVEKSGFVSGSDPFRYWGGNPPEDRCHVRFHAIDGVAAAAWAEEAMPQACVTLLLPQERSSPYEEALLRWLHETGGQVAGQTRLSGYETWTIHPSHVIRALCLEGGSAFLPAEDAVDAAIVTVFGGANSGHCDNGFLTDVLLPHAPMPVDGFLFYADADSG